MILHDFHIHTYYSTDSEEKPENVVKAAVDKKLSAICFTDHMDLDWPETQRESLEEELGKDGMTFKKKLNGLPAEAELPLFAFNPEGYVKELTALRKKYDGVIDIKIGAEFGLRADRPDLREEYRYLKKHYKLDFCLGSLHLLNNMDPYCSDLWPEDCLGYLEEYFETLYRVINEYEDFDSLAHMDYAARYFPPMVNMNNIEIDTFAESLYDRYSDSIDKILKNVIKRKKSLEVNTGGLKAPYNHTNPSEKIIKRYIEMGGELLTFGSDAHKADRVGFGIYEVMNRYKCL